MKNKHILSGGKRISLEQHYQIVSTKLQQKSGITH